MKMWLGAVTRTLAAVTVIGFCQTQLVRALNQRRLSDIASNYESIEVILGNTGGKHKRNAFFDMSDLFGIVNDTHKSESFENVDISDSEIDSHRHGHRSSPEWLHHVVHKDNQIDEETARGDDDPARLRDLESESTTLFEYHDVDTHLVDYREVEKEYLQSDYEANNDKRIQNEDAYLAKSVVPKKILPPQNDSNTEFQKNKDTNQFQMSLLKCHDGNAHAKSWFDLLMCENRNLGWVTVNFILGLLLFSLGILSLYRLLSLRECTHILPRTHFVTIHLLVFVAATLKSVYLFHLTYGGEERLPLVLILLLNDTSLPCLFSALSIKLLMVFNAVDLRVMNPKYSTIQNLSILIVGNVVFSFLSDVIVGTAYSKTLLIIARVALIFMALMISVLYMHKYSKITQISQLLKREFQGEMKFLVAPTDSPSRRQKSLKEILIYRLHLWCHVILGTSWSLVVYSFCHLLNTIFLVTSFVPAWAWWIFHIISCLTEAHLSVSILLAASLTQRYNEKQSLLSHFFVISFSSGKPARKINVNNDNSIYQRVSLSSVTESTKYTSQYNEVEVITPNVARSPSYRTPRSPRHKHATVRRSATFTGRVDRPVVSPYGHVRTPVPPVARAGSASQIAIYSPGSVAYSTGSAVYSPGSEIYNRSNIYSPGSNIYNPGSIASMLVQEEGFIRIRTQTDYANQSIVNTPLPPPPQLHIPPPPPLPEQEILHLTQNDLSGANQESCNSPRRIMSEMSQSPISENEVYSPLQNSSPGIIRTPSEIYNYSKGSSPRSTTSKNSIYSSVQASPKIYQTRSELLKDSPKIVKTNKNLYVAKEKNKDLPVSPEHNMPNNSSCTESNYSLSSIRDPSVASVHNAKRSSPSIYSISEMSKTPPTPRNNAKRSPPSIHSISEMNKTPPTPRNVLTSKEPVNEPYKKQNGNLSLEHAPLRSSPAKPAKPVKRTHSAVGYNSVKNQIYAALPSTQKFGSLRLSQMRKRKQIKGMNANTTKLINRYLDKHPRSPSIDEIHKSEKENIFVPSISKGLLESLESEEKNKSDESLKKDASSTPEEGEEEGEDFSYYKDDTDWAQELIKSSSLLAEFYSIKEAREKERYLAQAEDIKEEDE